MRLQKNLCKKLVINELQKLAVSVHPQFIVD